MLEDVRCQDAGKVTVKSTSLHGLLQDLASWCSSSAAFKEKQEANPLDFSVYFSHVRVFTTHIDSLWICYIMRHFRRVTQIVDEMLLPCPHLFTFEIVTSSVFVPAELLELSTWIDQFQTKIHSFCLKQNSFFCLALF